MDERDASELLDGVESGLRAPGHVRDRVWNEVQATLRGDLPLHLPMASLEPGPGDIESLEGGPREPADLVVALEQVAAGRRSSTMTVLIGAVAAAIVLVVGLVVLIDDGSEPDRVLTDIPADETLDDPSLACSRFLAASIDGEVFRAGEIDLAEIAPVEDAVERLRADFEASADADQLAQQLGDGSIGDLARVEGLLRQARLLVEQGDEGGARTTLALIPSAAERLLSPGGCLGALQVGDAAQ